MEANRCAQCVDDIGKAAHTDDELLQNFELVFQMIDFAGVDLSMIKCTLGQDKIELLAKAFSKLGIAPLPEKNDRFLTNLNPPTPVKSPVWYLEFLYFYRH